MTTLRNNLIANYLGNGWVALMSFAFVPAYIHFLGIESYGLIGFFVTFQALLSLLDLGLGASINRQMARLSVDDANVAAKRNLLRTLELIYWAISGLIALIVFLAAPVIAHDWLQAKQIPASSVQQGIVLMGFVFAARWPFALYSGALMGLQRQVLLNGIKIGIETLRSAGAVLILWLYSPTLSAFLYWQFFVAVLGSMLTAWLTWRALPTSSIAARFDFEQLRRIWRFAAGLSGISVTVVLLTQVDKVVLSRMLSLDDFGYYTLAWAVAGGLVQLIVPIFAAFYPRLTQEVAHGNDESIRRTYHLGAQLMASIILPVGITLTVFSQEVLNLWTHNAQLAEKTHLIMSIVLVGTCMNGLMNMPYALQLAYGWTRLALMTNIIAASILAPLVIFGAKQYGVVGAASVWVLLNLGYMLIPLQIMHTRLLKDEKMNWYLWDVLLPASLTLITTMLIRALLPADLGWLPTLLGIIAAVVLSFALCLFAMPSTRESVTKGNILKLE